MVNLVFFMRLNAFFPWTNVPFVVNLLLFACTVVALSKFSSVYHHVLDVQLGENSARIFAATILALSLGLVVGEPVLRLVSVSRPLSKGPALK